MYCTYKVVIRSEPKSFVHVSLPFTDNGKFNDCEVHEVGSDRKRQYHSEVANRDGHFGCISDNSPTIQRPA